MTPFEYAAPSTLKEAGSLLAEKWGETEILAGGTDLLTSLKQGITSPKRVVSLKNISELKGISEDKSGLRIGAMTTLGELTENDAVKKHFPSLVTAVEGIGSPQLLAVGTVGGDLCQRPRCWYYRNGFGLLGQKDGKSLVREGDNRYHAIFDTDKPALFVSASSLGPALIALGASITVADSKGKTKKVDAARFFQAPKTDNARETALEPNQIVTEVVIPLKGLKNATYEVRHRHGLDWPYVTASVAFGGKSGDTRVVLGHVAATPWVARDAATALADADAIDEATAGKCGKAAVRGAKPLSRNEYKVQLAQTAVKRAILAAAKA
jgi:xanthine dehydrogenase YagS FAD-binding subunit